MSSTPRIGISDAFDGGNCELVRQYVDDNGDANVEVRIKPDTYVQAMAADVLLFLCSLATS
jgi:hypothetical protein